MRELYVTLSRVEYSRLRPVVLRVMDHAHELSVWKKRLNRCRNGSASMDPLDYVKHRGAATEVHYYRELMAWVGSLSTALQTTYLEGFYLLMMQSIERGPPGADIGGPFSTPVGRLNIQLKAEAMTAPYGGLTDYSAPNMVHSANSMHDKMIAELCRPGRIQKVTSDHFEITPEETTMSTALEAVKIEEVTRVNGRDVSDISDGDLLSLIQGEKAKIENLQDMKIGSKRIVGIIEELKASVAELTAIFDSRS